MNHKVFGIGFPFESPLDQDVASEVGIRRLKKMSGQSTPPTPPTPQVLIYTWPPHTQPTYNEPPGLTVMQVQQVQPRGGPRPQAKLRGGPRQSMSSSSNQDPWTDFPPGSPQESELRRRLINRPIKRSSKENEQQGDGETANAAASLMRGNNYCSSTVLSMSSSTSAVSISTVAEQQTRPPWTERLRQRMQEDQQANDDDGVLVKETIVIPEKAPDDADSQVGHGEQNTIQTHVPPTSHLDIPTMPIFSPFIMPIHRPDPQWPEVYKLLGERAERRVLKPDTSLNVLERHEVIIGIEYSAWYTMHVDSSKPSTFDISFRTGPRIKAGHDVQFGSPRGLTPWHGSWNYDRAMQTFYGEFKYNYPETTDLKWVKLHRDGPFKFIGVDQENRKIEMILRTIRRLYTPSYCWRTEFLKATTDVLL